jgi:hypothetical protein
MSEYSLQVIISASGNGQGGAVILDRRRGKIVGLLPFEDVGTIDMTMQLTIHTLSGASSASHKPIWLL